MNEETELPSLEDVLTSLEEKRQLILIDKNMVVKILTEHTKLVVEQSKQN